MSLEYKVNEKIVFCTIIKLLQILNFWTFSFSDQNSVARISKIPWNQHQVFFRMIVRLKFNESFNIFGQTFLSTSPQMNWMTFFVLYNIGFVTKCYIIWCFVRHDSWMKRELRTFKRYYVAQHSWGTRKRVFWENPMSTKRASRNFYESYHFFS